MTQSTLPSGRGLMLRMHAMTVLVPLPALPAHAPPGALVTTV